MIAYVTIKLKDHRKNYVVYDLELTIVINVLNMWRNFTLGKRFTLVTDHISLTYFFIQLVLNVWWMAFFSEYEFDIKHVKGRGIKYQMR